MRGDSTNHTGSGSGAAAAAAANFAGNLAEAAKAQQQDVVTELLNNGANINAQDGDGNTALHWASWFRWDMILSQLIERGARVDLGNSSGETPVHWAAKSSNATGLETMTKHDRGTLSQRDCDGFTPFLISAQNDNAPLMEWMYLKGVSVEEQDDFGRTALQWACYKGHRRTVQWLLSRSASIAHRDHEGMTAVHWAALKGHDHVAEMLMDVGGVHLLHVPDAAGDTPIALAVRKRNRFLVLSFHKAQLLQMVVGRPCISRNYFANLFLLFIAFNIVVFAFFIAPGIASLHPWPVMAWACLMGLTLFLWTLNCSADPGWMARKTIFPQSHKIGDSPERAFDASQPVESQMVHQTKLAEKLMSGGNASAAKLAMLEMEQAKYNHQRHLITEARRRLENGGGGLCGPAVPPYLSGGAELQPLINPSDLEALPPKMQQAQLERAAATLREREQATCANVGRARVEELISRSLRDYVESVERGEFKQICVVCRVKRDMRSHHCKECGRCVSRLDHHCPWIDNCVGIGNQRAFYFFIVSLLTSIVLFYYEVALYTVDAAVPLWTDGRLNFTKFEPIIVLVAVAFNVVWLAFVGALVMRHSGYMWVNMTTYEVLVRPSHVQRRFPKARGRFWFLGDLTFGSCFRHVVDYWSLNTSNDVKDFMGPLMQESMSASSAHGSSGKMVPPNKKLDPMRKPATNGR